jgi:hypothetical protein
MLHHRHSTLEHIRVLELPVQADVLPQELAPARSFVVVLQRLGPRLERDSVVPTLGWVDLRRTARSQESIALTFVWAAHWLAQTPDLAVAQWEKIVLQPWSLLREPKRGLIQSKAG